MPKPVVRENDASPWVAALQELLTDRDAYQRESRAARQAAESFVKGLDGGAMERLLLALRPAASQRSEAGSMESLSPAKRALLLQRLHRLKVGR
jgi:hypothetical protein